MRLLLTGTNGQLGFELRRALAPLGEVVCMGRADCDLSDEVALRQCVRAVVPDVIVNAAAYTAVDNAESQRESAFAVNARAPGILGEEAAALGAWVVHYSTDYVFDGAKDGYYTETDAPNPQCVYGASKLAGEKALQDSHARYLIFRTSWVAGAHGSNFLKTMLRLASERDRLRVVADQIGAPTSASLIADVTAHAIRQLHGRTPRSGDWGIYHLAADGETNWHEYATHVVERARAAGMPIKVSAAAIAAIGTDDYPTPARRPANSRLDTSKLRETFGLHLPHWRGGVDYILDQIL